MDTRKELRSAFRANYPGELLNTNSTPEASGVCFVAGDLQVEIDETQSGPQKTSLVRAGRIATSAVGLDNLRLAASGGLSSACSLSAAKGECVPKTNRSRSAHHTTGIVVSRELSRRP